MRTRVAVAMSGGVDSSVACLLLARKGFDVIGLTMKLLPNEMIDLTNPAPCCTLEMAEDARRICAELGVPHYTVNMVEEFEELVIAPFSKEYAAGHTPNPCLACNRFMKFDHLLWKARELGADYIATGHYARSGRFVDGKWTDNAEAERGDVGGSKKSHTCRTSADQNQNRDADRNGASVERSPAEDMNTEGTGAGRTLLLRGVDSLKDQSYALYPLTQDELSHSMFPLGGLTKTEVRRIATESNLVTAEKPESQEICFVSNGYRRFLSERGIEVTPGPMLDTSGKVLGTHQGIAFYTIGQRKGLGVTLGKPLYVVDIDPDRNAVVLGSRDEAFSDGCLVEDLNVIAEDSLHGPVTGTCMVRYRGKEVPANIGPIVTDLARIDFQVPQFAVTPGQAAVLYQGEVVYGGGVIRRRLTGRSSESDTES